MARNLRKLILTLGGLPDGNKVIHAMKGLSDKLETVDITYYGYAFFSPMSLLENLPLPRSLKKIAFRRGPRNEEGIWKVINSLPLLEEWSLGVSFDCTMEGFPSDKVHLLKEIWVYRAGPSWLPTFQGFKPSTIHLYSGEVWDGWDSYSKLGSIKCVNIENASLKSPLFLSLPCKTEKLYLKKCNLVSGLGISTAQRDLVWEALRKMPSLRYIHIQKMPDAVFGRVQESQR